MGNSLPFLAMRRLHTFFMQAGSNTNHDRLLWPLQADEDDDASWAIRCAEREVELESSRAADSTASERACFANCLRRGAAMLQVLS